MKQPIPRAADEEAIAAANSADTRCDRRRVLGVLAGLGVGTTVWQRALAAQVEERGRVTAEMIRQAEWISGIELSEEDRESTARSLRRTLRNFQELRDTDIDYSVPPAIHFQTAAGTDSTPGVARNRAALSESASPQRPMSDDALAYLPVRELAALVRTRQVTSQELTRLYLKRLRKYNPMLNCVVTYTEETAMRQARRADDEIAAGHYRGPLHGIPWGAKDLISYPGYPTTWGAPQFREQDTGATATVARRLEEAGAVLVAKLALGALAQGDQWFEGRTNNPWNPEQGSSGSSAGSASAVAAGLVGFAIGSETHGSIVSPCRRCSATGLRPTFGRISRHGCMSLSWTMDKLGPITRSVEDCALVLDAVHGRDGLDPAAIDRPFDWPAARELADLRVGYVETDTPADQRAELSVLRELGVRLVPIELPRDLPVGAILVMLDVEAAAVFDELTRRGDTEGLNSWPATFRRSEFVPAVEYLRAARGRTLLMRAMEPVMEKVDLYVGGDDLAITNLTGHPTVVLPFGTHERDGVRQPNSITFTGRLFGESDLLAVAHHFQGATGDHLRHPPLDELLAKHRETSTDD
ncbi:MAG: amidase [Pirellulales bacterium]